MTLRTLVTRLQNKVKIPVLSLNENRLCGKIFYENINMHDTVFLGLKFYKSFHEGDFVNKKFFRYA